MDIYLKENERIDDLEYKNLKIIQNQNGFCFGMDSVLLSDFAKDIRKGSKIIDLGTGTGILSILLSKKVNPSKIIAVDIQDQVCDMAKRSVELNNLENIIEVLNEDIKKLPQRFQNASFNAVITNPPYKKQNTGLINNNDIKLISRHEITADLEDFVKVSSYLLKSNGSFYLVHRPERLVDIFALLRKYKLEPKIMKLVYPKQGKEPNLVLVRAIKNAKAFLKVEKPLFVYKEDGSYTDEILKIYGKE